MILCLCKLISFDPLAYQKPCQNSSSDRNCTPAMDEDTTRKVQGCDQCSCHTIYGHPCALRVSCSKSEVRLGAGSRCISSRRHPVYHVLFHSAHRRSKLGRHSGGMGNRDSLLLEVDDGCRRDSSLRALKTRLLVNPYSQMCRTASLCWACRPPVYMGVLAVQELDETSRDGRTISNRMLM